MATKSSGFLFSGIAGVAMQQVVLYLTLVRLRGETSSSAVHSYYRRKPMDLPCAGRRIRIRTHVRLPDASSNATETPELAAPPEAFSTTPGRRHQSQARRLAQMEAVSAGPGTPPAGQQPTHDCRSAWSGTQHRAQICPAATRATAAYPTTPASKHPRSV